MKTDNLCVNALRILSMDTINNAKSGHPGIALGAAPILYSLYAKVLNVTPKAPKSPSLGSALYCLAKYLELSDGKLIALV